MLNFEEREKIEVGQKLYFYHYTRYGRDGQYTGPHEVTKVTKTQFIVGGKRFTKRRGTEVGRGYSSSISLTLVTPESTKAVNDHLRKIESEKRAAENKASEYEQEMRKKYRAELVTDEDIHETFLKPLRLLAEIGEKSMSELLESFNGVTIKDENFWRVSDAIERETRHGSFEYGRDIRDRAIGLHQQLVEMTLEFETGTRYTIGDEEVTDLQALVTAKVRRVLNEQIRRFFGYTFSSNTDISKADQRFITTLREMLGENEHEPQIKKIKEEEVA